MKFIQRIWRSVWFSHLKISSMGAQSPHELHWLDLEIKHQDSSPSNCHQGDMPYWLFCEELQLDFEEEWDLFQLNFFHLQFKFNAMSFCPGQ